MEYWKEINNKLKPILQTNLDQYKGNIKGCISFYESPEEDIPDPTRKISLYNDENLDSITAFVKKDLLDNLNFCSHENVSTKFDKSMIENIFKNMLGVLNMTKEYFKSVQDSVSASSNFKF